MKKIMMLLLLSTVTQSYAQQLNKKIHDLVPIERAGLAQSMREVAVVYEEVGKLKKAQQYFHVALKVYPVGDEAHALALKLNQTLDDSKTYHYFMDQGKYFLKKQMPKKALNAFLMAGEVQTTFELYKELGKIYRMLNLIDKAEAYEVLSQGLDPEDTMPAVTDTSPVNPTDVKLDSPTVKTTNI